MSLINLELMKHPLNYVVVGLSVILVFVAWSLTARALNIQAPDADGYRIQPSEMFAKE